MDDDTLAQFTAITSADPARASQYLTLTEGNLEQALQLYFESDGADLGATIPIAPPSRPTRQAREVVSLDSDDDEDTNIEDDEAMARRLQDEAYGAGGAGGDVQGVRAPVARQAQTLMGLGSDWRDDPDELHAATLEQLRNRQRRQVSRPGIFNQAPTSSTIWDSEDAEARRRELSRVTAGASDASSKTSMLAEMYRPPFEIISKIPTWEGVRDEGKEKEKWILINVQDPNIFDCQVLNRDIWKNAEIQETVKENFIFKQYTKDDLQASDYVRFYFQAFDSQDAYPHVAIVDPRTGEQVKVWSGTPSPKPLDFLMQLHEFLDRYSLKANSRNPVATRKTERKKEMDVDKMTEEEMLEMAMQNSLENKPGPKEADPDILPRNATSANGHSKAVLTPQDPSESSGASGIANAAPTPSASSPFSQISASAPHVEPSQSALHTTRIQFRHGGGRVIRRFGLDEPVRRVYEWLKAEPLDGKAGTPFELIFMGRNMIECLDMSVEAAGLKNGSVMLEFVEE